MAKSKRFSCRSTGIIQIFEDIQEKGKIVHMDTQISFPSDQTIHHAAELLKEGEIVAFPTETVYGLGASIFNEVAIKKIYTVKGRPSDNPLIAHISSLSQVELIAKYTPALFELLSNNFFPGPLTLVVEKKDTVPAIASANLPTIGIRMPDHKVAWSLIEATGSPLVAPSANLSGKPSPTTAQHVFEDLQGKIPLILDGGPCTVGIESTVLDITTKTPTILRPGHITRQQLETVIRQPVLFSEKINDTEIAKAPGMKYRHYAPQAFIYLVYSLHQLSETMDSVKPQQCMLMTNVHLPPTYEFKVVLPLTENTLYAGFRRADNENLQNIILFLDEETTKNKGLLNRIQKAATKE